MFRFPYPAAAVMYTIFYLYINILTYHLNDTYREICSNIKYKSFYLYFPDTFFRLLTNNLPKISEKNEIKYLYFYRHLKTVYDIICLEKKKEPEWEKEQKL